MKTKNMSIAAFLLFAFSAVQGQQATSWKSHPVVQQLKESATGLFPDMPAMKGLVLILLMLAVAIWGRYFWVTWREMRMQSLPRDLHNFTPPDNKLSTEAASGPLPSLFHKKRKSTASHFHLRAASDAPSSGDKLRK